MYVLQRVCHIQLFFLQHCSGIMHAARGHCSCPYMIRDGEFNSCHYSAPGKGRVRVQISLWQKAKHNKLELL